MFVYYISVDVRKIFELVQPSAGVRVRTEYHWGLHHRGNSCEGRLTNIQERSNKSNQIIESGTKWFMRAQQSARQFF